MALSRIWVSMICVALAFGAASGRGAQLGAAAAQGVQQAVDFCLTVGGMICLWSGVMELMRRCGIAGGLSRLLRPVLRRLFPHAARDVQALDALSMNVSANLLGLGNAATPAGVRAAQAMARELRGDTASDELCLLVVLNTASIQLLPVTIAAVREAYTGPDADWTRPCYSPLFADLRGLPPTLVQVGTNEILKSDSERLVESLQKAGVYAQLEIYPECWHVFQQMPVHRAAMAMESAGRFVQKII